MISTVRAADVTGAMRNLRSGVQTPRSLLSSERHLVLPAGINQAPRIAMARSIHPLPTQVLSWMAGAVAASMSLLASTGRDVATVTPAPTHTFVIVDGSLTRC